MQHPEFSAAFSRLGHLPIDGDLVNLLNKFVCLLYGDDVSNSVDGCRYSLFKAGKCSDEDLLPNSDCLNHHIARSNYQAASWNRCLSPMLQLPPAVDNGWQLESDGQLQVLWMTRPSAPDSLLEFVQCKCKTGCKTKRCSCLKSGLKCTEVCSCSECDNKPQVMDEGAESDSSDSNDELEDDFDWNDDDNMFDDLSD